MCARTSATSPRTPISAGSFCSGLPDFLFRLGLAYRDASILDARVHASPHGSNDMAELSKSGTPLGPIGTKVLFENEHIRVWSVELPGKGHHPMHEHDHPYLIVPVSEGKALMRWEDGREREIVDVLGNVVYREASGGPHELFNLEDTKFHSILVEIKAGKPAV